MSSENDTISLTQQYQVVLPPEAVKMQISIAITKKHGNYQKALDTIRNVYVGEDNLTEAQGWLRNLNSFIKDGDEERKSIKEPYMKQGQVVDAAFKEFIEPFVQAKDWLQDKVNVVGQEVAKKQEEKRKLVEKETATKEHINNFMLAYSLRIAAADTTEKLLSIERLINLEKANKSKYGEFLPLLIERCNELNMKIGDQKNLVRQKDDIRKKMDEARKEQDDEAIHALVESEAIVSGKIADNTVMVQEQAASALVGQQEATILDEVKARRTVWKAELVNVKDCMKKQPDMLDVSLNGEKVRDAINTLKAAGTLNGKGELIINGIRYYEVKTF